MLWLGGFVGGSEIMVVGRRRRRGGRVFIVEKRWDWEQGRRTGGHLKIIHVTQPKYTKVNPTVFTSNIYTN